MKTFVCQVCGHIAFDEAPVECPVCGMAIENFENEPDAIKKPSDPDHLTELEKMHVPVIRFRKGCSLAPEVECIDLQIKVGEIIHVMESEHLINFIDLYVNKRYITRISLTHKKLYPAAGFHLMVTEGVITVVAACNVHGHWMARLNLKGL
jgi:desulfoferrodoxin-like iron-binding protein